MTLNKWNEKDYYSTATLYPQLFYFFFDQNSWFYDFDALFSSSLVLTYEL